MRVSLLTLPLPCIRTSQLTLLLPCICTSQISILINLRYINGIARNLGEDFLHLKFEEGAIEDTILSVCETTPSDPIVFDEIVSNKNSLNILITFHDCDTATDD